MKKFAFNLESCLKLRRHREEVEEIRLSELVGDRQRFLSETESLQMSLAATQKEMTQRRVITSQEANLYSKYAASLERKIGDLAVKLRQVEARIEIQRSILLKARQRRKVVDRLKEKRRERHRNEAERLIQAEMEELHLLQRGRQS
jgi:flagellar export protein FliJ